MFCENCGAFIEKYPCEICGYYPGGVVSFREKPAAAGEGGKEGAKEMEETTKTMASSKFQKSTKGLQKMFKSMFLASPKAWLLEKLMMLLEPFLNLLDLFSPIIEILAAIIELSLLPIIKELNPYILQAAMFLWKHRESIIAVLQVLYKTSPVLFLFSNRIATIGAAATTTNVVFGVLHSQFLLVVGIGNQLISVFISMGGQFNLVIFIGNQLISVIGFVHSKFESLWDWLKDLIDEISRYTGGGGGGGKEEEEEEWWEKLIPGQEGLVTTAPTLALLSETYGTEITTPEKKLKDIVSKTDPYMEYLTEQNYETNKEILGLLLDQQRRRRLRY